jgi:hypothetical protein
LVCWYWVLVHVIENFLVRSIILEVSEQYLGVIS